MPRWARWSVALVIGAIALSVGPRAHAQATVILSCGTPPATLALGTVQPLFQDATGKLCTGATLTGGSTTLNATSTLPTLGAGTQTPQGSLAGANYVQPVFGSASGGGTQVDATHGLPTNCIAGCAGGTLSNASDAVATSSTNGQTLVWLYGFNGATWDRLRDDGFGSLIVNGTVQAIQDGAWTVTANAGTGTFAISAASLPLPSGAATSALQSTINTTLGSPFQAGGSIGNTTFASTQSGGWSVTATQATGSNLHIVCDSGCSSSSAPADESAFTAGTTPQTPVGGFFQTTATNNPLTTGQMGAFQVTAQRALFANLRNSSGTEVATAGAPLRIDPTGTTTQPVSGTVTANQGGTWNVGLSAGANTVGKVDVLGNAGAILDFAGQNASSPANSLLTGCQFNTAPTTITSGNSSPIQCDNKGNRLVSVAVALPAGANTIGAVNQGTSPWVVNTTQWGSTNVVTGGVAGSVGVGGLAASGASVSGNPLQDGGRAQNAEATAVTNGQEVAAAFDLYGKQITSPWANRENYLSGTGSTTGTGATTIIATQGAGFKIYVTSMQCFRTDAGTTMDYVVLDDSASTPIPVPAGGGAVPVFNTPLSVAANTALTFAPNAGVTTMFCNAQGYKGA